MVLLGVVFSAAVAFLVAPLSARHEIRNDLILATDLMEEMFTAITRGFLSGSQQEIENPGYKAAQKSYRTTFASLTRNLREARFEHYVFGTEIEYDIQVQLVKCIEQLAQSLSGLRSAASTQFTLIAKDAHGSATPQANEFFGLTSPDFARVSERMTGLEAIEELPEMETPFSDHDPDQSFYFPSGGLPTASGTPDIFSMFISQLGPPMKSLAFTLKEILNDLPFTPGSKHEVAFNENFRHSLEDAKLMFNRARTEALDHLYKNRVLTKTRSAELAADYEEVAASCGHFSSCLQDFAEDTISYLDTLAQLKAVVEQSPRKRSWNWLWNWLKRKPKPIEDDGNFCPSPSTQHPLTRRRRATCDRNHGSQEYSDPSQSWPN
jgi:hypothetical protein